MNNNTICRNCGKRELEHNSNNQCLSDEMRYGNDLDHPATRHVLSTKFEATNPPKGAVNGGK